MLKEILMVLAFFGSIGVVTLFVFTLFHRGKRDDDCCHLSFKQFRSFYEMNPAKWDLYDDVVLYKTGAMSEIPCTFLNIFHTLQYLCFREKVMRRKIDFNNIQRSKQLITAIQNDIIETKKRAQKDILMSQAEYLEIISRIHVVE